MHIVLPGGSGHVGRLLERHLTSDGHTVTILTRNPKRPNEVHWDGRTFGDWPRSIETADAVVNLAGKSVSCRYTDENLRDMMRSRTDSARIVGDAIAQSPTPPAVWLQMSTATIYAHTFESPHDEAGTLGGREPDVPDYWKFSVRIAREWEATQKAADTPRTRKVALRAAMVMSPDQGSIFDWLSWISRLGLGGSVAGGRQYISWIHGDDFVAAVKHLLDNVISGPVNLASPNPIPQRDFMRILRRAWKMPIGLPAAKWMTEVAAWVLRSDTELLLKSRRVVPGRLSDDGIGFAYPDWEQAASHLVASRRRHKGSQLRHGAQTNWIVPAAPPTASFRPY
ncbi:epimerase [Haloglycomyces albus]|uniref:epimerase n=1 Tax=Haloglycomyces albus TaxID=526067 RepID=UPI00046D524D|nr:DUF1731 domain-containing protein [Haloglycomyces albus]